MTQKETLASLTGKEPIEGKYIFHTEDIPRTPFKILTTERGHSLIVGNNRLTEELETKEDVLKYIDEHKWELVLTLCVITSEQINKVKSTEKPNNNVTK